MPLLRGRYKIVNASTERWVAQASIDPDHEGCPIPRPPAAGDVAMTVRKCTERNWIIILDVDHNENPDNRFYTFKFHGLVGPNPGPLPEPGSLCIGHGWIGELRYAMWMHTGTDQEFKWQVNEVGEGKYTLQIHGTNLYAYTASLHARDACSVGCEKPRDSATTTTAPGSLAQCAGFCGNNGGCIRINPIVVDESLPLTPEAIIDALRPTVPGGEPGPQPFWNFEPYPPATQ